MDHIYHHPYYDIHAPHKAHHVHHPALKMWVITIILLALVVIFGFITVFIPWAVKDIGVAQRAWAFPFKTCVENTFSPVNEETCLDNDFIQPGGVPLTGGAEKCKAYILATIAFVFISVLVGVIDLLVIGYILEHLWWSPLKAAITAVVLLFIVCIACYLTWIFFIVYMEATCAENSIFPISPGYSYGWIMYLFATVVAMIAVATGIWGTIRIYKFKKLENEEKLVFIDEADPRPALPPYPVRPVSAGTPMWTVPPSPMNMAQVAPIPAYVPVSPFATITTSPGTRVMVM